MQHTDAINPPQFLSKLGNTPEYCVNIAWHLAPHTYRQLMMPIPLSDMFWGTLFREMENQKNRVETDDENINL